MTAEPKRRGLTFGPSNSAWNRYVTPVADDTTPRTLVFGGYRWRNDIAVEASFNFDRPVRAAPGRRDSLAPRGVGLNFGSRLRASGEPQAQDLERRRLHELDVLPGVRALRPDSVTPRATRRPVIRVRNPPPLDIRRLRDGVNYGLGLRYDMNSSLGLRLEYGRFGRFAGEIGTGLPETDQVSFGVQSGSRIRSAGPLPRDIRGTLRSRPTCVPSAIPFRDLHA